MKKTYSLGKRLLALVVTLALVLTFMPNVTLRAKAAITTVDMVQGSKKVDPSTIHNWKQYFGEDKITTEYTGGVWSDKTVFQSFNDYLDAEGISGFNGPNGTAITDDVRQMLNTDPANFLVTMSAITANKSLSGSSSTPMDTVLVLDVSGSMQGDNAVAVVQATNQAIKTLLDQNSNNRVGVVLYSGNHNFGNSNTGTASVLLPLGRYTTTNTQTVNGTQIPAYLTISGSGNNQTVSVASSVNNGNATDSKTVRGGTYIQNGLYKAWQEFEDVEDTKVPEGQPQAGAQRTPVVILMSDGAPTTGTTNYNNVQTSNLGDGGDTTNRIGFMTQLTAAWVRGKVQAKYNNTAPKFYTLGVGTGNDNIATSVLNPAGSSSTLTGYWNTFMRGTTGRNVTVNNWSIYKDAAVAGKNYVDQYWLTNDATGLINAFKQIVNTIVLESERHSTLVDVEDGADLSGYVTIEDELGELMEVKAVKGLTIGDNIFTGAELAKGMTSGILGTVDGPTEAGDELVRTVKERMGIAETSVAQSLIDNAYNAGQLSYTSATQYSNYIGWYADEDGKYVGFWQEKDGYTADNAPEGAKYINKSYGYLGEPLDESGAGSDMMHVVVMVHTEIATGHQSVVYKIPASLIPTVTYNVELNGEDVSNVKSVTREGADPMRLLVEVGLREEINAVNLEAKIAEHIQKGGHIHKNSDGTYTFYTNLWGDGDGGEVNYNEPLTHLTTVAHFHPALENERYYHVTDDTVYSDENGTVYNGTSAPSGTGYYFARPYYEVVNGVARRTVKYAPLSATSAAKAVHGENGWYVPAGTPHQLARFAATKTQNTTGTLNYSWNPVILHDDAGYSSYTFLGNNGTFTIAPAQGIALTKTVTETVAGAPEEFTFYVTLSQAVANPTITDLDGNVLSGAHSVNGNVITLTIKKDQTIVISGLPAGVTYTVTEAPSSHYDATIQNATGTVTANTVTKVEAENTPRVFNDLIVSKDVLPPSWMTDISALEAQNFSIRVSITGADPNTTYTTSNNSITFVTNASGAATQIITLKDAQSLTVYDLPAGARYSVAEVNVPAGHTANATDSAPITGTIPATGDALAGVTNTYEPDSVETTITLTGTKTFLTSGGYTVPDADWPADGFTVNLYNVDPATGNDTLVKGNIKATAQNKSWSVNVDMEFEKTGTYFFRIEEEIGTEDDIVYDGTNGLFQIVVIDDATGKLKVSQILPVQGTTTVTGTTVDKDFTNYKDAGSVRIPVQKIVQGSTTISVNDFLFGLFDASGELVDTIVGNGEFVIAGYGEDFAAAKNYTIREIVPELEDRIVGMTYDTTVYDLQVSWNDQQGKMEFLLSKGGVSTNVAVFTNTYEELVSTPAIDLSGTKTIDGDRSTLLAGERYTFQLYRTGADFQVSGNPVATDTVSGTDYGFNFSGLAFKEVGVYYYIVKEAAGTQGGVTYDTAEYRVTIHVVKALEGNKTILRATPSVVKLGSAEPVGNDALNFTNTYKLTQPAQITISGLKDLDGRELIADEFQFGLYENGALVGTAKNLTNGNFSFDPISYTAPGTHVYTVKEIIPDDADKLGGVTYDETSVYTVTVNVTDNGLGGLNVAETITDENGDPVTGYDKLVIENTYKASPVSLPLAGNKTWFDTDAQVDKTVPAGKFSFTLYRSNETYTSESEIRTVTNQAGGAFTFSMSYTEIGTYYYTLREDIGEDPTVAYDAGRYLIKDVVTDDGKGQLHVLRTITREGVGVTNEITFGNRYTPEPTELVISGTKNLTGRNVMDGEFTFELYDVDGQLVGTAENVGNSFTFDAITYDKSGTYTYTVKEKIPTQAVNNVYKGVTYDTTVYTVTVTVADVNGQLTATASHTAAQLVFNNRYEGADTHFELTGKKELSGNKTLTAGMFTFELYDENGEHIASTTNRADGSFVFAAIPLADVGDYTFTLKERNAGQNIAGIAYSNEEYTVKVSVTDPGDGQLAAGTPVITNKAGTPVALTDIVFQNSYSVAETYVDLRAYKDLKGRDLVAGEFKFRLYDAENTMLLEAPNNATGTVLFPNVKIPAAGTYTFTIEEWIPTDAVNNVKDGVTYTTNKLGVTVVATDNGDGTLSTEVTYDSDEPVFVNKYEVTGPAVFSLEGTKDLQGRPLNSNDVFTFVLKDASGNPVATTQSSGAAFKFENVELNTLGNHHFTVTEQAPAGGVKDGITYSTQSYDVFVRVSDNGKGQMVASAPVVTVNGAPAELIFTNTYEVTEGTKVDLVGKKTLTGKALHAEQFTFELYAGTDTTVQPMATVKNDADGTFKFENVALNTMGTNTFTVIEQAPAGGKLAGITYSNLVYTVTVETADNGKGGMTAGQPVYSLGAVPQAEMEFINTYAVEGSVNAVIEGFKTLEGGKKLEANMFTFELYEGDKPEGEPIDKVQNAADGSIKFNLNYGPNDIGKHTYTVKEVAPEGYEKDGIRYTYLYYNVDIVVADNYAGGLTVNEPVYRLGADVVDKMEFVNVYTPADTNVDLTVEKTVEVLSGDKEIGPKGFKFKVADESGKTIATLVTDKDGKAAHTLTFTAEDIGKTFTYKITEIDTKKPGITYSDAVYEVSITVGQAKSGELTTSITVNEKEVTAVRAFFRNTYEAPELPQTGDSTDLTVYAVVMALSALGFVAMLVLRKKEKYAN